MSASAVVAIVSTTTAAALLLSPRARPGVAVLDPVRRGPILAVVLVAAVVAGIAVGSGRLIVIGVLLAVAAFGGTRLVLGRGREVAALATRSKVIELCDAVQAELAAGQTAGHALERAAMEWPLVQSVGRVALTGGDVPSALRGLADQPGAGSLRVVAAAWQVAHRTGHGLADTLGRVGDDLRAAEQTRRIVAGELSSARATARLLAVLPVVALAMGSGAGGDPWAFLLGHPVGLGCLAAGLLLTYAGLAWIDALARDIERDAR